jgi:hypothetical protein
MPVRKSKATYHNQQMTINKSREAKLIRIRVVERKRRTVSDRGHLTRRVK